MKLILGDSKDKLKELPENSVDSIVTDPPYGLKFMSNEWDYDVPSIEIWKEALRVLKPGGMLLSFAGSRTYHRMAVNIEDAGFEIRDQIMWIYGSGFPKSYNIGKGIDNSLGNTRTAIGNQICNFGDSEESETNDGRNLWKKPATKSEDLDVCASEWEGWGTALKPAHEPIVMARKPLSENTIVQNVLKHGTGGINIDGSRVATGEIITNHSRSEESSKSKGKYGDSSAQDTHQTSGQQLGRFPANIIHDGSSEVTDLFPDTKSGKVKENKDSYESDNVTGFLKGVSNQTNQHGDSGSASRFFYCAKASKKDRNEGMMHMPDRTYAAGNQAKAELARGNVEFNANKGKGREERNNFNQVGISKNNHPTVKPTELMKYLVRMVTPINGTVLDPFMGSGSTGKACKLLDFDFIGIELDPEYIEIAKARIENAGINEEIEISVEQKKNTHKFFDI